MGYYDEDEYDDEPLSPEEDFRAPMSLEDQWKMARSTHEYPRYMLAQRHQIYPEVLAHLAKDEDFSVRYHLSGREDLPPQVVLQLAQSGESEITEQLAYNPSVTWDEDLPAKFVERHNVWLLEQWMEGVDLETWFALLEDWTGSVAKLKEASVLVNRGGNQ